MDQTDNVDGVFPDGGRACELTQLVSEHLADIVRDTDSAALEILERLQRIDGLATETTGIARGTAELVHDFGQERGHSHDESAGLAARFRAHVEERFRRIADDQASVDSLATEVRRLVRASAEVRGIAQQTHLVSINAAIQAAQAGEAGAGFAVVAQSVSALSNNAKDIATQIECGVAEIGQHIDQSFGRADASLDGEKALLLATIDRLTAMVEAHDALRQRQEESTARLQRMNQELSDMVLETMAVIQFQDIVRQKVEAVDSIVRKIADTRGHDASARSRTVAAHAESHYRMAGQRTTHETVLGHAPSAPPPDSAEDLPDIELF